MNTRVQASQIQEVDVKCNEKKLIIRIIQGRNNLIGRREEQKLRLFAVLLHSRLQEYFW